MNRVLIIAEAGVNHNGSLENAKLLINKAAEAGADYVKFQTFKTESLTSKAAKKADYQQGNLPESNDDLQFNMLKKLELKPEDHFLLIEHCKKHNIQFLSTAFDLDSIDFLKSLDMGLWKIPSGEITNLPYLQKIGALKEKIILSTGMCTLEEISEAIKVLEENGTNREMITVLHCNTEYPTPYGDVNLRAMLEIGKQVNVSVGYSDHTLGIEIPVAAVALGASIIEKHFTLDKAMEGPDHKASLDPIELKAMVSSIRNIEMALGSSQKKPSPSEIKNIAIVRKSIHARGEVKKGQPFTMENLQAIRPGDGISPMEMNNVIGKTARRDIEDGHKISWTDIV